MKGTCDIQYLLNSNSGIIEGIEGVFETQYTKKTKTTVSIFLDKKFENIHDETVVPKRKNFFDKLFNL